MFKIFHDVQSLQNEIGNSYVEELTKRFSNYLDVSKTFILEEKYVDKEWREEYSLLYSFTSYEGISSLTKRLHLFRSKIEDMQQIKKVNKDDYLGFVVFRPVPPSLILKAILKPLKETLGVEADARFFMPLCKIETHIGAEEFALWAFPFYSQDSMVTVCAHASMFMNCLYLSKKQWGNRPSLRDFVRLTPPTFGRNMPSEALTPTQMLSILASMGYNVRLDSFEPKAEAEDIKKCLVEIDTYVESALPPILMYGQHVVLVVGHSLKNAHKDYVVFDDSGYHLEKLAGKKYFAHKVSAEALEGELRRQELVFVATFEFERQYFPLKSVELVTNALVSKEFKKRILLVDSRDLKKHFKDSVGAFENMNLSHFLWLVEIYDKNEIAGGLIFDASTHKYDYNGSLIALWNKENIKFYKYSDSLIKIGAPLVPFANLQEIEK